MRILKHCILVITSVFMIATLSTAQSETLEFEGANWIVGDNADRPAIVEDFLGRPALFLSRNQAQLESDDLRDMVIEYEYASTHPSGFIGVNFRADAAANSLEQFYTRPHQSGQPDATQYMVMINGSATWQLHAGPNEATAVDLPAREWIKVRIVAIGDRADIFVSDMETPLLHVPNLRFDGGSGKFSLYASDRPWRKDTGAYFSNITVRAATPEDEIIGTPRETDPRPEGLLTRFDVSSPFAEEDISEAFNLADIAVADLNWTALDVEDDGVANLARTAQPTADKNTVLVRLKITSEADTHRLLSFGYSDRVRLYIDGKLIYSGNAQWRARDHRFLGTVALVDQIALHLKAGETEIIAAVSESFGGWGFKAQLENQSGLTISPWAAETDMDG